MVPRGVSMWACGLLLAFVLANPGRGDPAGGASPAPGPARPAQPTPEPTLDEVLGNIEAVRKTFRSCTARVTKERTVVPLEDTELFDGTIRFKPPRMLRMELRSRDTGEVTIYIVGREYAWIYRPADKQAEGLPLRDIGDEARRGNPLEYGLASSVEDLKKSYDLALLPPERVGENDTVVLRMRPKGAPADVQDGTITLWLSKKTWLPLRIREIKNDGDVIETHTFSEMSTRVDIPDAVFDFQPGKDVDVVIHRTD